jgi:ribosomal protein S18 acetylase RimI-like enzyme
MKLLVRPSARRQGIAGALMREVEELARGHGRTLLVLDTAGDVAERFYRRLGYLAAGTIPGYARSAQGALEATVIFYKVLPAP